MTNPPDERSPLAIAATWASRIITISLEMVIPGLLGYWLDNRVLNTKILFTLLGFGFGLTFGTWHLIRMTKSDGDGQ